jgi:trk system potassium uptake protein
VTRSDNANLMSVEIATHLYGVPRTIARLFNPEREEVYRKLGVRYVSSTGTIAKLFLNEFQEESYPLHVHFPDSDVAMVDLEIDTDAHAMTVEEFEQDGLLRVAAVRRGARVFIPDALDRLERDDLVTAAMKPGAARGLTDLVRPPFGRDRSRRPEPCTSCSPAAAASAATSPRTWSRRATRSRSSSASRPAASSW